MEICPVCGLPKEACVCQQIGKEKQRIRIEVVKRRYGKLTTLIHGIESKDIKEIAKKLKTALACGGTVKNNIIELQGDHRKKVKEELVKLGFPEENIEE